VEAVERGKARSAAVAEETEAVAGGEGRREEMGTVCG
jgi:hypothetical protein